MPEAYRLAGDAELAGDLGLTDADGEQLAGSQPAGLEPFTFLVCRRAASDGRHASILTRRAGPLQLGHHPSSRHPRPVSRGRQVPAAALVPAALTAAGHGDAEYQDEQDRGDDKQDSPHGSPPCPCLSSPYIGETRNTPNDSWQQRAGGADKLRRPWRA